MNNPLVVLCDYGEPGPAVTNQGNNNGVLAHLGRMDVRRDDDDDDPSHDWTARTVPQ